MGKVSSRKLVSRREQNVLDLGKIAVWNQSSGKLGDRVYFAFLRQAADREGTCVWDGSKASPSFGEMAVSLGIRTKAPKLLRIAQKQQVCDKEAVFCSGTRPVESDRIIKILHACPRTERNEVMCQPNRLGSDAGIDSVTICDVKESKSLSNQFHVKRLWRDAASLGVSPATLEEDCQNSALNLSATSVDVCPAEKNTLVPDDMHECKPHLLEGNNHVKKQKAELKRTKRNAIPETKIMKKSASSSPRQSQPGKKHYSLLRKSRPSTRFRLTPRAANLRLTQTTLR